MTLSLVIFFSISYQTLGSLSAQLPASENPRIPTRPDVDISRVDTPRPFLSEGELAAVDWSQTPSAIASQLDVPLHVVQALHYSLEDAKQGAGGNCETYFDALIREAAATPRAPERPVSKPDLERIVGRLRSSGARLVIAKVTGEEPGIATKAPFSVATRLSLAIEEVLLAPAPGSSSLPLNPTILRRFGEIEVAKQRLCPPPWARESSIPREGRFLLLALPATEPPLLPVVAVLPIDALNQVSFGGCVPCGSVTGTANLTTFREAIK